MKRDMCWEWNWPHRLLGNSWGISFDLHILLGDHSPGFHCCLIVGPWALLDFGIHNRYHMDD